MHLGFSSASAVIPAPSSPDGSTEALRRPKGLVAGDGPGGVGLPGFGVLAGRNDRGGATGRNGVVAFARVESTIGGDGGDFLLGLDLIEQFGQHGGVADIAGGELGGPDLQ